MQITSLGPARLASPLGCFETDEPCVPASLRRATTPLAEQELCFEKAGPRARLFFDPRQTRAAIVTCGGLCPGLNNVIRSLFLQLHHFYGVTEVLGFRGGYQGLDPKRGQPALVLTPAFVDTIHKQGGTVLGTSRGPVDVSLAVSHLIERRINILFCVGGDGTQRGAQQLFLEAQKRGYPLAVVGVPKTIDNDVRYVSRTFGYLTALEESRDVIDSAHNEAKSVFNGVSLVKLMGRHAGFIAAGATVASQDVNFTLIPEVPFQLRGTRGLLPVLKQRLLARQHAVIVAAEGAGQELIPGEFTERDPSGNLKLQDIGLFLRDEISAYFKEQKMPVAVRYLDPSYHIRSRPANCADAILCDQFARHAAHAAMAGKTGLIIGYLYDTFVHVPIELIAGARQYVDPEGELWQGVLSATGQPARFGE